MRCWLTIDSLSSGHPEQESCGTSAVCSFKRAAAAVPSAVLPNPGLLPRGGDRGSPFLPSAGPAAHLSRVASVVSPSHGHALRQLFCLVVRWRPPWNTWKVGIALIDDQNHTTNLLPNSTALGNCTQLIYVHFKESQVGILCAELFKVRSNTLARSTPCCCEIHQNLHASSVKSSIDLSRTGLFPAIANS